MMTRCGVFARFVSRKWMMRQRFRTPEGRTQRRATTNIDNTTKGEKHQQPEESRHGHDRTSWSQTDMVIIRKACRGRKGWKGGREATEVIDPVMVGKIVARRCNQTNQQGKMPGGGPRKKQRRQRHRRMEAAERYVRLPMTEVDGSRRCNQTNQETNQQVKKPGGGPRKKQRRQRHRR